MLRRAVIQHLRTNVAILGGRVYQAFLAPPDTTRPYATVKLPAARGSPVLRSGGTQPVEVRLYTEPASFVELDDLELDVVAALHAVDIVDQDDGEVYRLRWMPGGGDFHDETRDVISRLVYFEAAVLVERS